VNRSLSRLRDSPAELHAESRSRPEVRIVVGYLIVASIWIVGSDLLLTASSFDKEQLGLLQSLKGLNFTVTTALLLYFVLRRAYGGWRVAEQRRRVAIEQSRERFRRLCSHVQSLREGDRIRIAREIHDELGQLLTGIKMEVRLLENRLADRNDRTLNHAIDNLVEISDLVDDSIVSVQNIAWGLRPSILDNLGLGTALIHEAGQFSHRCGIPCEILVEDFPNAIPPEVATAAFRIFQESLTNVARHANARRVDSKLSVEANVLKLAIHDDGKGIDPSIIENPKSLGLIGMMERAESVDGLVVFTRHPHQGTDVILTVPL